MLSLSGIIMRAVQPPLDPISLRENLYTMHNVIPLFTVFDYYALLPTTSTDLLFLKKRAPIFSASSDYHGYSEAWCRTNFLEDFLEPLRHHLAGQAREKSGVTFSSSQQEKISTQFYGSKAVLLPESNALYKQRVEKHGVST